ncbi:MAG: tRNA 2-selenouridine(34) synthase MnmH [Burkholderiales bacterium]|jgi:tRNA 2-selenouridine synthase
MIQDAVNVAQLQEFDEIVDVRSPSEYKHDHIPGAINCPVLSDEERARVGTLHARESAFAARRVGAALVSRNIAAHLETVFADKPRKWRPLIYCWRGGQRSGSMTIVLRQAGWDAKRLEGGYKAFRRFVVSDIARLSELFRFQVVCGLTGSGKSALLRELQLQDAQVLDLEGLARHRGSVLGNLPSSGQPGQKMFDSRIWETLSGFDPERPVYVEAESRKIGNLRVPEPLMNAMRGSACLLLQASMLARIQLLIREYQHFIGDPAVLCAGLDALSWLHGRSRVAHWKQLALQGDWTTLVRELLENHYDPAYRKSSDLNYTRLSEATSLPVAEGNEQEFTAIAGKLRSREQALPGTPAIAETRV